MDGRFVPNISFGFPVMKTVQQQVKFDVHLMIVEPEKYVDEFINHGADLVSYIMKLRTTFTEPFTHSEQEQS
jgi:ribulose-phosphate 3-epimerase